MPFPPVLFAPVIEHPSSSAFITQSPEVLLRNGSTGFSQQIPAIFSMTSQEGLMSNYGIDAWSANNCCLKYADHVF